MINLNLNNMNILQRTVKNTGTLFSAEITSFILILLCAAYIYYSWLKFFGILLFVLFTALILSNFTDLNIISIQKILNVWNHNLTVSDAGENMNEHCKTDL